MLFLRPVSITFVRSILFIIHSCYSFSYCLNLNFNSDNLGGIGRDNVPGHNTEDLDAFNIYSITTQTSRAINKYNVALESAAAVGPLEPAAKILRCFVHERVIRYEFSMVSVMYCIFHAILYCLSRGISHHV